jgi:hypothetical protein
VEKPSKEKQEELRNRFLGSHDQRAAKHREEMNRTSKRARPQADPQPVVSDDFHQE